MLFRLCKLSPFRIFLLGFAAYLVIFNFPEVLLHVTSIGIGGQLYEIGDVLLRQLMVRTLIFGPITFFFTFTLSLTAITTFYYVVYLPILIIRSRRTKKPFSFSDSFHSRVIMATACGFACFWKLGVEVSDPQTSRRQFNRDIGISLPNTASNYRAFHSHGGFLSTAFSGKETHYNFHVTPDAYAFITDQLKLESIPNDTPEFDRELDRFFKALPEAFLSSASLKDFKLFRVKNKEPPWTSCRFLLYRPESEELILTAFTHAK